VTTTPPLLPADVAALLPTPCMLVDVAACERNIMRAARYFESTHAKLRPHFKAHKCTKLLARQVAAGGCVGVTCATAMEAEVLADNGFADILVANQVVTRSGLTSLARAARASDLTVVIDHHHHVAALDSVASAEAVEFGILIEVDVGMHRCGLQPGSEQLLELAQATTAARSLTLRGLQGYEGHAVSLPERSERRERVQRAGAILAAERARLLGAGYPCPIVSGGGTGTFDLAAQAGILDEIQAGSYVLMDADYARLELGFENALLLVSTVISHPRPRVATIDAGLKALTAERGMPQVLHDGLVVRRLADEHAWLSVADGESLQIGQQIFLVPAHVDPAVNLHDVLFAWDSESCKLDAWPVDGRRVESREAGPGLRASVSAAAQAAP
jgi:D-serine deaminase-like pyridoxal phosphate-dependent protein